MHQSHIHKAPFCNQKVHLHHLPGCSAPGHSRRVLYCTGYHRTSLCTFVFSTWIFYSSVPCFVIDFPCGFLYQGLTICIQHVSQLFGDCVLNSSWSVSLAKRRAFFVVCCSVCTYVLLFRSTSVLYFSVDVVPSLSFFSKRRSVFL